MATLAATASFAQSTVTITGIVDVNYSGIKNLGDQTTNQVGQNGAQTSTFKIKGTEDLGGGTTANFQFEVQPQYIAGDGNKFNSVWGNGGNGATSVANNGTQFYNQASQQSGLTGKGQSYLGLKDTALGEVQLGTINTATFGAFAAVSGLGTGVGSGYGSGNVLGDFTRVESSVAYFSPTISGFDFRVQKGVGNDSAYGITTAGTTTSYALRRPSVTDFGIGYSNGPLAVKYATLKSTATPNELAAAANVATTTKLLGGLYDAGVAKIGAATGSVRSDAATPADSRINLVAVTVPYGAWRFIGQSVNVKNNNDVVALTRASATSKTTGYAVERDLSKRTFVYLRAENTSLAGASATSYIVNGAIVGNANWDVAGVSSKRTVTAVGISHSF